MGRIACFDEIMLQELNTPTSGYHHTGRVFAPYGIVSSSTYRRLSLPRNKNAITTQPSFDQNLFGSSSAVKAHHTHLCSDSMAHDDTGLIWRSRTSYFCLSSIELQSQRSNRRSRIVRQMARQDRQDDKENTNYGRNNHSDTRSRLEPSEISLLDKLVDSLLFFDSPSSAQQFSVSSIATLLAIWITPFAILQNPNSQILFVGFFGLFSLLSLHSAQLLWDDQLDSATTRGDETYPSEDDEDERRINVSAVALSYVASLILVGILTPLNFESQQQVTLQGVTSSSPLIGAFFIVAVGLSSASALLWGRRLSLPNSIEKGCDQESGAIEGDDTLSMSTEGIFMHIWDEKLRTEEKSREKDK